MYLYDFIVFNKELLKPLYGFLIGIICGIIVLRTDKLFHLSLHQGIRYFRNAFFFYGIAFIIRYLSGALTFYEYINPDYNFIINIIFEFFLIMAGFFLIYSLIWKKLESPKENNRSSLFNIRILVFYILTLIIVILDYIWDVYYFLFASQIILFFFATIISYKNFSEDVKKHTFPKFYFIAMFLSFIVWILNALAGLFFEWSNIVLINIYSINVLIFLIFLYGVVKVTNFNG